MLDCLANIENAELQKKIVWPIAPRNEPKSGGYYRHMERRRRSGSDGFSGGKYMRTKKSERLIRLEDLRERERRYLEAIGFQVNHGKGAKPIRLPQVSYAPDFWDMLKRKRRKYERENDKGMLAIFEDMRHFATKESSDGLVPLWLWNWLKYIDVAPIHWSETAECEEGEPVPEDEYNGVEEGKMWWHGKMDVDELSSERFYRRRDCGDC